jgi:hypothetical protein
MHQNIPLHYAACFHARASVLHYLLTEDPSTKHAVDTQGRTALHWYFTSAATSPTNAAGEPYDDCSVSPTTSPTGSSSTTTMVISENGNGSSSRSSSTRTILDQWDLEAVRLLATSRTARTVDQLERTVLHTACQSIGHSFTTTVTASVPNTTACPSENNNSSDNNAVSNNGKKHTHVAGNDGIDDDTATTKTAKILQVLFDAHAGQLVMKDTLGRTPVLLLLETFLERQKKRWEASSSPSSEQLIRFTPPPNVIALLQKNPTVASLESNAGKLPLHLALAVGSSYESVQSWLNLHPPSLLHVDECMRVALHEAFRCPWSAMLQEAKTIDLMLQTSCEKNGIRVDGRLALKMEDTEGHYAIHWACSHGASVSVLQTLMGRYPKAALLLNPNDDLPLQCLLSDTACRDPTSIRDKVRIMLPPLLAAPRAVLQTIDSRYGMMPLHIMVYCQAARYAELLKLLEACPASAEHFAKAILGTDGPQTFSPLDLHEMNRPVNSANNATSTTEWHLIRELLYSFAPTLESHRHRQELLDRCVAIILDDITGDGGSLHLRNEDTAIIRPLELTHSVSNMEAQINTKTILRSHTYLNQRPHLSSPNGSNSHGSTAHRDRHHHERVVTTAPPLTRAPTPSRLQALPHMSFSMSEEESHTRNSQSGNSRTSYSRTSNSRTSNSRVSYSRTSNSRVSYSRTSNSRTGNSRTSNSRTSNSIYDDESTGLEEYDTQSHIGDDCDESSDGSFSGTEEDPTEGATTLEGEEGEFTTEGGTYSSGEESSTDTISHSETQSSYDHGSFIEGIGYGRKVQALELKYSNVSIRMDPKKMSSIEPSGLNPLETPRRGNQENRRSYCRPSFMSEVGMRLWTFFMLYRDPKNPGDNYSRQVGAVVEAIDSTMLELMSTHPIPPYSTKYIEADQFKDGLAYRDVACPKCREIVQKTCFFVGLYDFRLDGDVLLSRGWNGNCIDIKAFEWIFTTEEETEAKSPGVAEENIWSSGERPPEVGLTYRTAKRSVMIRFLTSKDQYESEIVRQRFPCDENGSFLPIRAHFNALGNERKVDITYESQIRDPQFNKIKTGTFNSQTVELEQYPFAVVYELPTQGSLMEYNRRYGLDDPQTIRQLATDLVKGLSSLHDIRKCDVIFESASHAWRDRIFWGRSDRQKYRHAG